MLYDQRRWEPGLEGFIRFCETKDPGERYDFVDLKKCAVAQYLQSCGVVKFDLLTQDVDKLLGTFYIVGVGPYTFGAALARAREYAATREAANVG